MTEELNYKEEVEELLKVKTDSEITEEFLLEFEKLCRKYNRTFSVQARVQPEKVNFPNDNLS
jgi:hypothetical protein